LTAGVALAPKLKGVRKPAMTSRILLLVALCVAVVVIAPARAQNAPAGGATDVSVPRLIERMAGTWNVAEQMWPGPDAAAVTLPPAVARRRLVGGAFLQEVMEAASNAKADRFTRVAYLDYNAVDQQYEYVSLDTRAPQVMVEKTYALDARGAAAGDGPLTLYGGSFVAPRWGAFVNAAFRYRLVVGPVANGRQVVQLYLTPLAATPAREFLAFQYVYTRRR
jgi:Protein of unknown function (DUF1579)